MHYSEEKFCADKLPEVPPLHYTSCLPTVFSVKRYSMQELQYSVLVNPACGALLHAGSAINTFLKTLLI